VNRNAQKNEAVILDGGATKRQSSANEQMVVDRPRQILCRLNAQPKNLVQITKSAKMESVQLASTTTNAPLLYANQMTQIRPKRVVLVQTRYTLSMLTQIAQTQTVQRKSHIVLYKLRCRNQPGMPFA
jgi:hypothetical protein